MGLPTFATLINDKVVVPPKETGRYEVERHFFQNCMADLLAKVPVDENWYLATYPDVGKALSEGVVPDCKSHYIRFGYYEHRMPFKIEVDEKWYLKVYPDIEKAVERRSFTTGQAHFDQFGFREGRLPYANFSLG